MKSQNCMRYKNQPNVSVRNANKKKFNFEYKEILFLYVSQFN